MLRHRKRLPSLTALVALLAMIVVLFQVGGCNRLSSSSPSVNTSGVPFRSTSQAQGSLKSFVYPADSADRNSFYLFTHLTSDEDLKTISVKYDGRQVPGYRDSVFTLLPYEFQTWGTMQDMYAVVVVDADTGWHEVQLTSTNVHSDTVTTTRRLHIRNEMHDDTIHVVKGWNIVSPLLRSVPAGFTRFEPEGIQESAFYSFGGTYHTADSLFPDKGYWLKTNAPGILILGYSQNRVQRMRPMNLPQPPGAE